MCERFDCPIKNKIIKKGLEEAIKALAKDDSISHVNRVLKNIITMLSNKTSCQTTEYLIKRCNDVCYSLEGSSYTTRNDDKIISILINELNVFILAN